MRVRVSTRLVSTLVLALGGVIAPTLALAQQFDAGRVAVVPRRVPVVTDTTRSAPLVSTVSTVSTAVPLRASSRIRSLAPIASAIAPGTGQFILGDDRFVAYAAVELLGWLKFVKDTREQAAQERTFRDLARRVARAAYSPNPPDGNWTYYEAMRDWPNSGQYTTATDGSVVPTTDITTYNGYQWQLAQQTTPDAASALAQYERLAYKPEYEWSWDNAQLQHDIYNRTTFKRDDAHYAGVEDLIVLGANHFLSMVDAFATFRLSVHTDESGRATVGASVRW
ncbi:MAG TPA: hypothetical protein VGM67_02265 [Gemmatimonadaceae bacterium]|jgi:hypothetical protein